MAPFGNSVVAPLLEIPAERDGLVRTLAEPTLTAVGVTWLYGFQFEIKVIAKLP